MNTQVSDAMVGKLRDEIIESQKLRVDLLKWKLFLVAVLAATGLGLGQSSDPIRLPSIEYVLCVIPFVCIYVDCLCFHNSLRILVIATFLIKKGNDYEKFFVDANQEAKPFAMEQGALKWSTIFVSLLIIGYGVYKVWPLNIDIGPGYSICLGVVLMLFICIVNQFICCYWLIILLSLLIMGCGVYKAWPLNIDMAPGFLIFSGLFGLILSGIANQIFHSKLGKLNKLGKPDISVSLIYKYPDTRALKVVYINQ